MSDYGHFEVGATYPDVPNGAVQDEYDVLGLDINNGNFITWERLLGDTLTGNMPVRNVTEVDMTDVTLTPQNVPAGCQLTFDMLPALAGGAAASIGYELVAGALTVGTEYEDFPIESYANGTKLQQTTGYYFVQAVAGHLSASINSINTTVNQDNAKLVEFVLTNDGAGESGEVTISLPSVSWLRLVSTATIANIAPGESVPVTIEILPTDDLPLNTPATGTIAINTTNANAITLPYTVQKVSDEKGGITVDVINQFTYFTEEAPHVDSARVRISHYFTGEIYADALTAADGTVTFDSLPEGQLRLVVDARRHKSYDGVIDIAAGASFTETVFLEYQAVSNTAGRSARDIIDKANKLLEIND